MHTIGFIVCLITLPIVLLLYFTASKQQHAKRMRRSGCTYRIIAQRQTPQEGQAVLEASFQGAMGFLPLGHEHNS
jgi:hypothetical protein